ncbi:MAG: peptidase MA family metallohydrolase, partial [Vicinamibacterales bacterium]
MHTRRLARAAEAASARRRPGPWLAALVLTALAGTVLPWATRAASASSWRRIDTPHFTVIGSVGERELGDVAAQFERFREVLAQLLPPQATAPVVPTVVIAFGSDKDFDPFKPVYRGKPIETAGLFVPSADLNYIAVVAGSRGFRTVFHEYAHLVTANLRLSIPVWLNEGVAEYYSTFELLRGGRNANIGQPITSHVLLLRDEWLKLDALLAVQPDSPLYNEGDRRSVFYAQSWALVHYLLHGTPPRRDWLVKYMSAIEAGTSEGEAWNHIFGTQPVEAGLRDYVHRSQFQMVEVTLAERVETRAAAVGALSDDDAEAFLGDFVARQKRQDEVPARLELAAERPDGARARGALARLRARQNRPAEARALLARTQAATGDWLADYAVGVAAAETFA